MIDTVLTGYTATAVPPVMYHDSAVPAVVNDPYCSNTADRVDSVNGDPLLFTTDSITPRSVTVSGAAPVCDVSRYGHKYDSSSSARAQLTYWP